MSIRTKGGTWLALISIAIFLTIVCVLARQVPIAPDEGKLGGPLKGLNAEQLHKFYDARTVFTRAFTPEEGLGPLFNGASCFECHGQPGVAGGEGRDLGSTGVIRIGKRSPASPLYKSNLADVKERLTFDDVDLMITHGGPALQRKSITSEFPNKYPAECQAEIAVAPADAELISLRHSPPLFGFGLMEAIPDAGIEQNAFEEMSTHPDLAGRVSPHKDPLTRQIRLGRFGWKNQHATLLAFTAEALNVEMGITTYIRPMIKNSRSPSQMPAGLIKYLPAEPNDNGKLLAELAYFQDLLAPPARGPVSPQAQQGEAVFNRLQCAVCHRPEMETAPTVYVVDPDSPFPALRWVEIPALENQPVKAYSDFLVHKMGNKLADGLPQEGSKGGEWRTTPLWGLRFKKFYLHNGSATTLEDAISMHGGQAQPVISNYNQLSPSDKASLVAFLDSL